MGEPLILDAGGMTLTPGLVEGHAHPSFTGVSAPAELGRLGPEQHMLLTAQNLALMLSHGFTSAFEAASAKPLLGVSARDAIAAGMIVGPRLRAAGPEIPATAGLGDERKRRIHEESFGLIADGPGEMRRVARECCRDGVDTLKIDISGDEFVRHRRGEIAATDVGAAPMGLGGEPGGVKPGYLADLLLVDGDLLADVSILQHSQSFALIMKDGEIYKDPRQARARR